MKYLILILILFACIATPVQATMQRPDIITHDGLVYKLRPVSDKYLPLESLWSDHESRPNLSEGPGGVMSSACWRGYVAIWQVEDGILYFIGLDAWQGDKKADLKILFPKRFKEGKVKADWFTGQLTLGEVTLKFNNGELSSNKACNGDKNQLYVARPFLVCSGPHVSE